MEMNKKPIQYNISFPNVWGGGQILAFSGIDGTTDFENGLCFRTLHDGIGLELMLPAGAKIVFGQGLPEKVVLTSDVIDIVVRTERVRGAFLDALHFLMEGECTIVEKSEKIAVKQEKNITLIGVEGFFVPSKIDAALNSVIASRLRWLNSLNVPSLFSSDERRSFLKAASIMKSQVCTPSGFIKHRWTTPDRWPHRRMWLWDSAYHAIGWRHLDIEIARECIESVFDSQFEDGRISCTCGPDIRTEETQPPVLGTAVMAIDSVVPDVQWLKEMYMGLCRYVTWDIHNRSSVGGLLGWHTEKNSASCRCGESGMDNSPRFDGHVPLNAVDFNSYAALECENLCRIARKLGKNEDAVLWNKRYKHFSRSINQRLWNEEIGIYMDCCAETGEQTGVLSGAGFLPLICGASARYQAERLARHLKIPGYFATALPLATVSPRQPEFYSKDMWRGPAWVNLNWLIHKGFLRYGFEVECKTIADKTLKEIERCYKKYGTFFEFYDDSAQVDPPDLLRKGKNEPGSSYNQVIHDYGWTAALYVDWKHHMLSMC